MIGDKKLFNKLFNYYTNLDVIYYNILEKRISKTPPEILHSVATRNFKTWGKIHQEHKMNNSINIDINVIYSDIIST